MAVPCPITAAVEGRFARLRVPQAHANLVKPRVWILRRKTQSITTVEVIGEADHVRLKSVATVKQLILASSHPAERFRSIPSQGLPERGKLLNDIDVRRPFVSVCSSHKVGSLGQGRKWQCVDGNIVLGDEPHNVVELSKLTTVVASFTNQQ